MLKGTDVENYGGYSLNPPTGGEEEIIHSSHSTSQSQDALGR